MKEAYLGIDIGSISTKGVIIDEKNNILASSYIWTEGNPLGSAKRLLGILEEQFDKMAEDFKMDKEQIKGMFGEEQMAQLKEDLAVQKAIDFLVAEAKFVD